MLITAGLSTSLILCPLPGAVFGVNVKSGSLFAGIAYGLVYGPGIFLSSIVLDGGILSLMARIITIEVNGLMPYLRTLPTFLLVFKVDCVVPRLYC